MIFAAARGNIDEFLLCLQSFDVPNGMAIESPMPAPLADGAPAVMAERELFRLRQEVVRLRRQADQLREAAQLAASEPDTRRLAHAMARQFGLLVDAEAAWILVFQDGGTVAHGFWDAQGHEAAAVPAFEPGRFAAGQAAIKLEICVMAASPVGYEIAVPIVDHQNRLLGLLHANHSTLFTEDHLRAARVFALQAALGLERARSFDRIRNWTKSLEMMVSFNAAINTRVEPAQLLRRLVESAARFLDADAGRTGFCVPAHAPEGFVMMSDTFWRGGRWLERNDRWEMGQGIPGFLLGSKFSYIANEYQDEPLGDASLIDDHEVRRALCVPIKNIDEGLLGFVALFRGPGRPIFTWQDAAFLESLGHTTGVAIHNAQLLKSLEVKNEQMQALSADHVKHLEEERKRVARELHDEAGQALIGVKLGLQVLARKVPADPPELLGNLGRLHELVNRSAVQIKDLARRLRPPVLDELGLKVTLRQLAADFTHSTGVPVDCNLEEPPERLPPDAETALYRIAQEALTNAARHSSARRMALVLRQGDGFLQLRIEDDGVGFDPEVIGKGLGLLGMRERAEMLNARFVLDTDPGEGTRITVTMRYDEATNHSG